MSETLVLNAAVAAAFGALTAASVRRYRQRRHRADAWLCGVFGGLTLATAGGLGLAAAPDAAGADDDPLAFLLLLVVGLLGYPVALYLFGDALSPVPRSSKLAVVVASITLLLLVPATLSGGGAGVAAIGLRALMIALLVLWVLVHVVAAVAVWRSAGRLRSALTRARARNMLIGVVGMGAALLTAFVPGVVADDADAPQAIEGGEDIVWVPLGLTALAAATLWFGFAPPRWLRVAWMQQDADRLVAAELALQRSPGPAMLADRLLPEVTAVADGSAAWFEHQGEVVATVGVAPGDVPALTAPDGEGLATTRGGDGRWYLVADTDGGRLAVRTDEEPVLWGAGDLDLLEPVAVRITTILERARMEQLESAAQRQLDEARHLERVAELKDDVLSTLSHELRTPLVALCGVAELLDTHWHRTDDRLREELIGRVRANADDLRGLVEDALDLASMRVADTVVVPRPVVLAELLAAMLADARVAGWGETIAVDVPAHLEVSTDPAALSRILRQLVSNARKFSPAGSEVAVRAHATDDEVRIEVEDQGPGLEPEQVGRVFEPFYRAGDVLTRGTRGLGVGLALAHETARRLGGSIEVTSVPGAGATFTVRLPADGATADG